MKLFVNPKPDADPNVPGLVWEAPPTRLTDSGHWEMTDAGQAMMRPRAGEPLIFLVQKGNATNNPFAMGVTVGRVESNDIVVDDGSCSRFHAWLQRDERTKEWSLTDAESKNGTWVDGVQLSAKQRVQLRDGAKLKFGDVEMTFLLPIALKTFVGQRFGAK
ncbi:MAG: FHA domain-containing protein [Archangium sp.]|nr:FHA domain-containing protein [Archangium sp.]MDP3157319.1 FHA domain-containing protein [Archangium sp.]MDP3571157.1 FHA domain-containing protein [Archangium sp.]